MIKTNTQISKIDDDDTKERKQSTEWRTVSWMTMTTPERREGVDHARIWGRAFQPGIIKYRGHGESHARHSQEASKGDKVAKAV